MRYKITIEYDGTSLLGWQEQLDGPSVQDYLQKALNCFTPVNDTDTCSLNNKENQKRISPFKNCMRRRAPEDACRRPIKSLFPEQEEQTPASMPQLRLHIST